MGNSFGFLHSDAEGGFQFKVVDACKAAAIDLNQTCNLTFGPNRELIRIGNVTRGTLVPKPGIAGVGIWYAMMLFFGVLVIALLFILAEVLNRWTALVELDYRAVAYFRDSKANDASEPGSKRSKRSVFSAAGRTFVLGVSDTQTIFIGAFVLGFAGQSKCELTSYHFTVAVSQMMIALSAMVFSVALVRTYWRNPAAAAFRLLLSTGSFIGVGLTIFRKSTYAPDWPPPSDRQDSAILLPVACLLDGELRTRTRAQAEEGQAELGFGSSSAWPPERYLFITLIIAFMVAHASIPFRYVERRMQQEKPTWRLWHKYRGIATVTYWAYMLIPPTFTSVWCWVKVYKTREWVNKSGWMGSPNPEMLVWDSGQLIAMGVLITVMMNMLTEVYKRESKSVGANETTGEEDSIPLVRPDSVPSWQQASQYEPYRS